MWEGGRLSTLSPASRPNLLLDDRLPDCDHHVQGDKGLGPNGQNELLQLDIFVVQAHETIRGHSLAETVFPVELAPNRRNTGKGCLEGCN